jgi:hypothetical protein
MNKFFFGLIGACILFANLSCEEPSTIGSSLLQTEQLNLKSESDFMIDAKTIQGTPVVSLIQNFSNYSSYFVGAINDPIFGPYNSEVFTKISYNSALSIPNFARSTIDSAVLIMTYDSTAMYGDVAAGFNFIVDETTQLPKFKDTVYSDVKIPEGGLVRIGDKRITINRKDSITLKDYSVDTVVTKVAAQLRIPLSASWLQNKLTKVLDISTNALLQEQIKGLKLSSNARNTMLGLNFGAAADDANSGVNGIKVFYRDSSGSKREYRFLISSFKYAYFTSNLSSQIKSTLGSSKAGEERLYLQSLDGVNVRISFTDLVTKLKGKIINQAFLEMPFADIMGNDLTLYPLIPILNTGYYDSKGYKLIRDIQDLLQLSIPVNVGYGGEIVTKTGTPLGVYKLNITKAIKDIIKGSIPNDLEISTNGKNQRPHRAVINGTKHPTAPTRLVVTYTEPD